MSVYEHILGKGFLLRSLEQRRRSQAHDSGERSLYLKPGCHFSQLWRNGSTIHQAARLCKRKNGMATRLDGTGLLTLLA